LEELKTGLEFGLPLPGLSHHNAMVMTYSLIAMVFVLVVFTLIAGRLRKRVPNKVQLAVEMVFEYGMGLMEDVIGKGGSRYYPLIAALFFYILTANLMGIVPGMVAPTTNININLPMAIIVFVVRSTSVSGRWGWAGSCATRWARFSPSDLSSSCWRA